MGGFNIDHLIKKKEEDSISDGYERVVTNKPDTDDSDGATESRNSDLRYDRGEWAGKLEFILSVVGYSVGVGNIWRFPYLVMQNGGGAFLIPFFFFLILCGVPLFFLELSLGQFSGTGCIFVWKFCPLFKGVGYMMIAVSFVYCWYYIMVLVWVLVYFVNSFVGQLPWGRCDQEWNSLNCVASLSSLRNETMCNTTDQCADHVADTSSTASKEFWHKYVLQKSSGIEEIGSIQWHLALALVVAWLIIFLCLMKGIKSVGKVVYVTALLPYVLLTIFLVKGLTLPGAMDGIIFYLKPDFSQLLNWQVWLQAAVQVFYSLGPAWGGLITMASYNKFNNNCLRDAVICCAADGFTSFYGGFVIFSAIGYIAKEANLKIEEVATSGPGLALVVYPEAITKLPLPQIWAALFFLMLLALGVDSQFGVFETLSSGLTDTFPRLRKRKILVTAFLCCVIFLLDLPYTTRGGIYLYQLVDWYFAAFCVVIISFLECFLIGWVYGLSRYSRDIELMMGQRPPILIQICWKYITPAIMLVTFLIMSYEYSPPTYDGYSYPTMARVFGNILAVIPLLPLPVVMLYQIWKADGTLLERIRFLLKPDADWGPRFAQQQMSLNNKSPCFEECLGNSLLNTKTSQL